MPDQHVPLSPDPTGPADPTALPSHRGEALAAALVALDRLAELGETVEDEWTYVTALAEAGRARLRAAVTEASAALPADRAAAVAAACTEASLVVDPHRAIDWLSTLPAVVELALTEAPAPGVAAAAPGPTAATGPVTDTPARDGHRS
jgi:hypothetical protein